MSNHCTLLWRKDIWQWTSTLEQWKCWKTLVFGALCALLMSNNCTLLWRKDIWQWKCWKKLAHLPVKMLKNSTLRNTFWQFWCSNNCTLLWRRSRQWRGVCNWVSQSLPWGGAMNIALVQCCFLLFFCRYTDLPQMMRFVSRQWRGICKWVLQSLLWSVLSRTCSSTNVVFRVIIAMVVLSTTCPSTCVYLLWHSIVAFGDSIWLCQWLCIRVI